MAARAGRDRGEAARATGRVSDHGLFGQVHDARDEREVLTAAQARKPVPVPALVNVIERGDRVARSPSRSRATETPHKPQRSPAPTVGAISAKRARRAAARPSPAHEPKLFRGRRVGDVQPMHRALERQVVIEVPGILCSESGAPEGKQQGRLEQVGQLRITNVGLRAHRHAARHTRKPSPAQTPSPGRSPARAPQAPQSAPLVASTRNLPPGGCRQQANSPPGNDTLLELYRANSAKEAVA